MLPLRQDAAAELAALLADRADQELFETGDAPLVQTGSSWVSRSRRLVAGEARGLELHYPLPADGILRLGELVPGVPFRIEVRDVRTNVLAARDTTVAVLLAPGR